MKVTVELSTREYCIRQRSETDSWDIGEDGLDFIGVTVRESDKDYDYEVDAKVGDTVVVLIEHYSDGCTFGSSEYMDVKGVYKTEMEAITASESINTDHGYFGSHIAFLFEDAIIGNKRVP